MTTRLISRLVSGFSAATRDVATPWARRTCHEPTTLPQIAAHDSWLWWNASKLSGLSWAAPGTRLPFSSATASTSAPSGATPLTGSETPVSSQTTRGAEAATSSSSQSSNAANSNSATAAGFSNAETAHHSVTTAATENEAQAVEAEPPAPPLPDPKPELVDKFLSSEMLPTGLQRRLERRTVLRDFQRHPADTGSPQVMVAMWTHRVRELVRCFDENRKMLTGMRDLEMLVNRRRRMLIWLRRADFDAYSYTISKLGLKDVYTPTGISDRYREGLRPSDPVTDDAVNRWRFSFHRKYRQKKTLMWWRLRPKLVAEDPRLEAMDVATAAASKQHRQQQRQAQALAAQDAERQQQEQQQQQQRRR